MAVQELPDEKRIMEHMPYNHSLLFQVNAAVQNIYIGGSGFEQIQCLRAILKPIYRDELNKKLEQTDLEYNNLAKILIDHINTSQLNSRRFSYQKKLLIVRREYTKYVINQLITIFDKYNESVDEVVDGIFTE